MDRFDTEVEYDNRIFEVGGFVTRGTPRTMEYPGDPTEVEIETIKYKDRNIYGLLGEESLIWFEEKVKEKLEIWN